MIVYVKVTWKIACLENMSLLVLKLNRLRESLISNISKTVIFIYLILSAQNIENILYSILYSSIKIVYVFR